MQTDQAKGKQLEIKIFLRQPQPTSWLKLDVLKNSDHWTSISYREGKITVDRSKSGDLSYSDKLTHHYNVMVSDVIRDVTDDVMLHVLVDTSGVRVFGNPGTTPVSTRVFPPESADLVAVEGDDCLLDVDVYSLKV